MKMAYLCQLVLLSTWLFHAPGSRVRADDAREEPQSLTSHSFFPPSCPGLGLRALDSRPQDVYVCTPGAEAWTGYSSCADQCFYPPPPSTHSMLCSLPSLHQCWLSAEHSGASFTAKYEHVAEDCRTVQRGLTITDSGYLLCLHGHQTHNVSDLCLQDSLTCVLNLQQARLACPRSVNPLLGLFCAVLNVQEVPEMERSDVREFLSAQVLSGQWLEGRDKILLGQLLPSLKMLPLQPAQRPPVLNHDLLRRGGKFQPSSVAMQGLTSHNRAADRPSVSLHSLSRRRRHRGRRQTVPARRDVTIGQWGEAKEGVPGATEASMEQNGSQYDGGLSSTHQVEKADAKVFPPSPVGRTSVDALKFSKTNSSQPDVRGRASNRDNATMSVETDLNSVSSGLSVVQLTESDVSNKSLYFNPLPGSPEGNASASGRSPVNTEGQDISFKQPEKNGHDKSSGSTNSFPRTTLSSFEDRQTGPLWGKDALYTVNDSSPDKTLTAEGVIHLLQRLALLFNPDRSHTGSSTPKEVTSPTSTSQHRPKPYNTHSDPLHDVVDHLGHLFHVLTQLANAPEHAVPGTLAPASRPAPVDRPSQPHPLQQRGTPQGEDSSIFQPSADNEGDLNVEFSVVIEEQPGTDGAEHYSKMDWKPQDRPGISEAESNRGILTSWKESRRKPLAVLLQRLATKSAPQDMKAAPLMSAFLPPLPWPLASPPIRSLLHGVQPWESQLLHSAVQGEGSKELRMQQVSSEQQPPEDNTVMETMTMESGIVDTDQPDWLPWPSDWLHGMSVPSYQSPGMVSRVEGSLKPILQTLHVGQKLFKGDSSRMRVDGANKEDHPGRNDENPDGANKEDHPGRNDENPDGANKEDHPGRNDENPDGANKEDHPGRNDENPDGANKEDHPGRNDENPDGANKEDHPGRNDENPDGANKEDHPGRNDENPGRHEGNQGKNEENIDRSEENPGLNEEEPGRNENNRGSSQIEEDMKHATTAAAGRGQFVANPQFPNQGHLAGHSQLVNQGHLTGQSQLVNQGHLAGQSQLVNQGHLAGQSQLVNQGHLAGQNLVSGQGQEQSAEIPFIEVEPVADAIHLSIRKRPGMSAEQVPHDNSRHSATSSPQTHHTDNTDHSDRLTYQKTGIRDKDYSINGATTTNDTNPSSSAMASPNNLNTLQNLEIIDSARHLNGVQLDAALHTLKNYEGSDYNAPQNVLVKMAESMSPSQQAVDQDEKTQHSETSEEERPTAAGIQDIQALFTKTEESFIDVNRQSHSHSSTKQERRPEMKNTKKESSVADMTQGGQDLPTGRVDGHSDLPTGRVDGHSGLFDATDISHSQPRQQKNSSDSLNALGTNDVKIPPSLPSDDENHSLFLPVVSDSQKHPGPTQSTGVILDASSKGSTPKTSPSVIADNQQDPEPMSPAGTIPDAAHGNGNHQSVVGESGVQRLLPKRMAKRHRNPRDMPALASPHKVLKRAVHPPHSHGIGHGLQGAD